MKQRTVKSQSSIEMRSVAFVSILFCAVICAAAVEEHTYDGRNGPHIIGPPGQQVYIRGQNEGPYQVDGVGGTFQNSPNRGEHVYTDEQGNTYVNKNAKGSGHSGNDGYSKTIHNDRRTKPRKSGYRNRRRNNNYISRRSGTRRDRRNPQLKVDRRNPEYLGNSFRYPNGRYRA